MSELKVTHRKSSWEERERERREAEVVKELSVFPRAEKKGAIGICWWCVWTVAELAEMT